MAFSCVINLSYAIIYYDYIVPSVAGMAALSMIPPIFILFRAYHRGKIEVLRSFFYAAVSLLIVIFFTFVLMAINSSHRCHYNKFTKIFRHMLAQAYVLQNVMLIGWFFYRLEFIFRETIFALPKSITTSFLVIYPLYCIFSIISGFLWAMDASIFLISIAGGLTVLITAGLVVMFIYKLCKIFNKDQDQDLLMVMRKTAFLVFISTSFVLVTSILSVLRLQRPSMHISFVYSLIITLDLYSSFLCILFTFNYFDSCYLNICGWFESKCYTICCKRYVETKDLKNVMENSECSGNGDIQHNVDFSGGSKR